MRQLRKSPEAISIEIGSGSKQGDTGNTIQIS